MVFFQKKVVDYDDLEFSNGKLDRGKNTRIF